MKYIFTVHSPITFLVAYSIVKKENLNLNDVIVLSSNYELPIPFGKVVPAFPQINAIWYKKIRHFNVGKSFDQYLKTYLGTENFIAFIDIMHAYQKLLVTHSNCKAFHFFEEGTDSYMLPHTLVDFTRTAVFKEFRSTDIRHSFVEAFRVFRGYPSSLYSLPYHAQPYQYAAGRKYYCLSKFCYPGVADELKIKITPSVADGELLQLTSNLVLENALIIVEETYPDRFDISDAEYQTALGATLYQLDRSDRSQVFLKLRPGRDQDQSRLVRILNELKIEYQALPNAVLAEGIFLASKNLKVIGFVSSLLFYASIFGHKGYSMLEMLQSKPKTRFDHINGFWNVVKRLK